MKQWLLVLDFRESFKVVQKQVYFESEPFCKIACPVFFYKKPLKKGMEFKFIEYCVARCNINCRNLNLYFV